MTERGHFISIWFFIGGVLLVYGILILLSGVYDLINPPKRPVAMSHLHAAVWWGALLVVLGIVYCVRFRPGRKDKP